MALEMIFETPDGDVVPNSYWVVVQLTLNTLEKRAHIVLHGYRSEESRAKGKTALPDAVRGYVSTAQEFEEYFSDAVLLQGGVSPTSQAYEYAKSKQDVLKPSTQEGQEDTYISYFETARDV